MRRPTRTWGELLNPPYNLTVDDILDFISRGRLTPYEKHGPTLCPDPTEPPGLQRLIPAFEQELQKTQSFLAMRRCDLRTTQRHLDNPEKYKDELRHYREHQLKKNLPCYYASQDINEQAQIDFERMRMDIIEYEEEIRRLEEELTPSKIWGREISNGQWALLEQQLRTALFLVDEVETVVNSRNASGSTDTQQTQTVADTVSHGSAEQCDIQTPAATITEDSDTQSDNGIIRLSFYKAGDYWMIGEAGREKPFKNLKGFEFIALLLQHPNQRISCIDLYHNLTTPGASTRQYDENMSIDSGVYRDTRPDASAIRDAERRLGEIEKALAGEYDFSESDRQKLVEEQKKLQTYLGRTPRTGRTETARKSAQKGIGAALKYILAECPELESYLQIKTGTNCAYTPPADLPIEWITDPPTN